MPSTSPAQRRFMAAAAHNPAFAKRAGIPTSVAREFNTADQARSRTQSFVNALRTRKPENPLK